MQTSLLELLARHQPTLESTVLWVGRAPVLGLPWSIPAPSRLTVLPAVPGAFEHLHGFDAMVIAEGFERDPWPRWALQRAHRCLKPGGVLLLQTRGPGALASLDHLTAAARRATFSGRRFIHKRLRHGRPFPKLAPDTTLSDQELMTILDTLHFEVVLGPEHVDGLRRVVARARPSLYSQGSGSPFPDPGQHRSAHEQALAADFARRDAWASANPQWAPGRPEPLDPAKWSGRTLVVLSPHPDDEIIGCGGTLLRAIAAGAKVICIQASDGSAGAALAHEPEAVRIQRRLDEALEVGQRAGFARVDLWREDNRNFAPGPQRARELAALLRAEEVAAIFVPFVTDTHPDHVALARVLAAAIESAPEAFGSLEVLQYEVWSCVWPSHVVDITAQAQRLEELLCCYDTALRIDDYVHLCERRGYYNSLVHAGRPGYAEVLHCVPAREFPTLLRSGAPA